MKDIAPRVCEKDYPHTKVLVFFHERRSPDREANGWGAFTKMDDSTLSLIDREPNGVSILVDELLYDGQIRIAEVVEG